MKNKWIYIAPFYGIAICLQLYALTIAKNNEPRQWIAIALSLVCLGIYFFKKNRYIKQRNLSKNA
jgi:hypothetical protein